MAMSKAIVTIIVGEKYQRLWQAIARPNWEKYANRYGYQMIVFRDLLDASPIGLHRSPAWQKLLTLGRPELKNVDRVLWLDADILINPAAPDAVESVAVEKVGAVADQALLSSPSLATPFAVNNGWQAGPAALSRQFYESNGFVAPSNYHLNSGVWVASPRHHREPFEHIYRSQPQRPHSYLEQAAFSAAIIGGGGYIF